MNPTDIDELLHQHATRWIEGQPPAPSLEAAVNQAKGPSRPRVRYLAIAACVIAVLAVAAITVVRTPGDSRDTSPAAGPSNQTRAKLSQIARSSAAANGDSNVTAEAVLTTYLNAEHAVLGGDTSSSPTATTPVWVVQIHGSFVCNLCRGVSAAAAPKGHVITLILIAATLQDSDFNLGNQPHNLASLGSVITLTLSPSVSPGNVALIVRYATKPRPRNASVTPEQLAAAAKATSCEYWTNPLLQGGTPFEVHLMVPISGEATAAAAVRARLDAGTVISAPSSAYTTPPTSSDFPGRFATPSRCI